MSKQSIRYQVALQSIPCAPDTITSSELLSILVSKELIDEQAEHRSQMRTVQRVLDKLFVDYPCIDKLEHCRPHRYQIAPGHPHPLNPSAMSSVVSLQMIEHEILNMLPPGMRREVSSLLSSANSHSDKKHQLWRQRFAYAPMEMQLEQAPMNSEHIDLIEKALLEQKTLTMHYRKRGARHTDSYTVTPLGIAQHGSSFYLLAKKAPQNEDRTFAIHRIESLKLSFSAPEFDPDFETKTWIQKNWNYFSGGKALSVKLRIVNYEGEHLLQDTKISACQEILEQSQTHTTVRAKVRDCNGLHWWLLKNLNVVEVLEPASLRRTMLEYLKAGQELYGEEANYQKPETRNQKPETRNQKPETRN